VHAPIVAAIQGGDPGHGHLTRAVPSDGERAGADRTAANAAALRWSPEEPFDIGRLRKLGVSVPRLILLRAG
jgi:hypothetical protein